ncbi:MULTISPECIES: hypothetical protein [environmental samples]|uniref:hypothetical protein n=1 Tax=environmental samples TaxID=876090 RepID=UPI00033B5705|nr:MULTISPECIES: hypothetical protein [environmental samples]CDC68585.1 putative uncharacterized protein [Oscillibacter sp. CAG:155]
MAQFSIPAAEPKYSATIEYFRGIDLLNSPSNVDESRSPAAPNMIRDQVGKVRKRMGYTTRATAPNGGRINGVHFLNGERLIHAGTKLYKLAGTEWTELADGMADARSKSFSFDGKLYLLDGNTYRVYDGTAVKAVSEEAYVPTIIISRSPDGGGTTYEALNLLGLAWKESFLGKADVKEYQLTTIELGEEAVKAEILGEDGEWSEKTEGTDFTVDREKGLVTFHTAPGESPVKGQDNVRITASKAREGYADKINKCRIFAVYGVGGAEDRVFLSGNPDEPGQDWYSGFEDPTYFPDTAYTKVSRDGSAVVGYAILGNTLATFLQGKGVGRNAVVRTGSLDADGEALFRVTNTLLGEAPVAPFSFAYIGKEPLFLTERGIYAITAEELTGEKYTQERSYLISSALMELAGKADAAASIYRDFYVLSIGGDLYLLDGQQRTYEKNSPYSSYQYEAYYWPGIGARLTWTEDGVLWFGTEDGKLKEFAHNVDDPESYNDDGQAIDAYWETSDFDGKTFFKNKTFTAVSVRLAAAVLTGVKIYAQRRGIWNLVYDAKERARYFDWSYIDFSKFVFSSDRTPRTLSGKVKIKKVDKTRFRLQNKEKNEPFGIYAFGVEWKEPGSNYKR